MRFIGDVHAKFDDYVSIVDGCERSIQVGDFGAGFKPLPHIMGQTGLSETLRHKFIRGNHDNPEVCRNTPTWIPDGTLIGGTTMMLIGGALSIDRHSRIEGRDWWSDEECTMDAMYHFMDIYEANKPEVMVTHDCPESIALRLFSSGKHDYPSRTRQALDAMLGLHAPKLWIFGHWHMSRNEIVGDTRFICLAELEYKDIDL